MRYLIFILVALMTGCAAQPYNPNAYNQMMQGLADSQRFARGNAPQIYDGGPGVVKGNNNFDLYKPYQGAPNSNTYYQRRYQ